MSDEPHLVLIETSGRAGQIGLARGGQLLAQRRLSEGRRNARDLAPEILAMLRELNWSPKQLDAVVVSCGPGSYTGLRVGLMSAKTLAYATGCALLGIETFAAIAQRVPEGIHQVDVLGDAQKDKVYVQSFRRDNSGWSTTMELSIRPFADWCRSRDPNSAVTGPGLVKWQATLPAEIPVLPEECRHPDLAGLLLLGLQRFRTGERDDPFKLEPLYLRASSAEEQWDRLPKKG